MAQKGTSAPLKKPEKVPNIAAKLSNISFCNTHYQ
jgi:hypothetical protein